MLTRLQTARTGHTFARMRFGHEAWRLDPSAMDERRMRFYTLALHLSLVAGPLRFLDRHVSGHEDMRDIGRSHTEKVSAISSEQP